MSFGKDNVKYYMPLTKGHPQDGPTTSVFSVPRVQYSPETEATVKNLMRESRLTFTQKHVFDTILRNGRCLPEQIMKPNNNKGSLMRQSYMQNRHKHKARLIGIPLLDEDAQQYRTNSCFTTLNIPTRRSFDSIKASGDLEPPPPPKFYFPVNKDAEKDRFIHKLAYGKETNNSPYAYHQFNGPPKNTKKSTARTTTTARVDKKTDAELVADLKKQRIDELIDEIEDRMKFLLTMKEAKKVSEYKGCILNQINEKLHEMKEISPEKEKDIRESVQLDLIHKRLGSSSYIEHRTSKFFE